MAETVHDRDAADTWGRARAGDPAVRDELCGLARDVAVAELRRRGVSGHDADELAQEAVASLLRYLERQPVPPRDLRAFLKYRAFGVLGDWRKRMRLRRNTSELDEAAAPPAPLASGERPLERSDLRVALADCLSRLPDAQRQVVALRYRTAEASRAIASRLGIDKSTVNVRTFRALRALRECLTRRGFGAEDLP